MFKKWFEFSLNGNGGDGAAERRNGSSHHAAALMEPPETAHAAESPTPPPHEESGALPAAHCSDFERVYRDAGTKPPEVPCGILKVVEMMNSQHLSGLSPEARRCAVLMALEAAGAQMEDLLQDAVLRQRALNDYEKQQEDNLRRFDEAKTGENRGLQAELDRLTAQYMARLQANLDEVAREQDAFRAWRKKKQQEAQRIAEAAAFCVPESIGPHGGLTAVLERACAARGERL